MILALLALAAPARAEGCSCSVGGGDGASCAGPSPRGGGVVIGIDYGASQTGGEGGWQGFSVTERGGNSMATMAMPGHFAQTLRLNTSLGVGGGTALYASLPWIDSHPLFKSDMPGDVDAQFLGDVGLGARYGHSHADVFWGLGGGLTLPTGKVLEGGGARGGRGALGVTGRAEFIDGLTPHFDLGGAVTWSSSLYPGPKDGYLVGPAATAALGARLWPREQGRTRFDEYLVLQHTGTDRFGSSVLYETGITSLDLQSAFWWRFWADRNRSASTTVRATVPIAQVIGDPWLAQNWAISAGISVVAN